MTLQDLITAVEGAEAGSDELSARVVAALMAPAGCYVEKSRFNGAWCIYQPVEGKAPRLFEDHRSGKNWRPDGWPVTTSLDAAVALIERKLPGACPRVEPRFHIDGERIDWLGYTIRPLWDRWTPADDWFVTSEGRAKTAPLALCAALLRALQSQALENRKDVS